MKKCKKKNDGQIEITRPIKLLKEDGSLTSPGWARNNIIEYNREAITAPQWRIKEWDFYQIGCKDFSIQINFFNISIATVAMIDYVDLNTGKESLDIAIEPFTIGKNPLPRNGEKPYVIDYKKFGRHLRYEITEDTRRLYWKSRRIEMDATMPNYKGESIVIMNPYKRPKNRFFFTEKINCMPTNGYIKMGKKKISFDDRDDIYTVLDWGRGPWKHKNFWYWGNGTTEIDGKLLGFEITWGIGDPSKGRETAIMYDGKCHKLGEVWLENEPKGHWMEPWIFHEENGRFEMTMTPIHDHHSGVMTPLVGMLGHQVHGMWNGTVTLDDGKVIEIHDMYAFCEKVFNRW